jgi:hypothetical protein
MGGGRKANRVYVGAPQLKEVKAGKKWKKCTKY